MFYFENENAERVRLKLKSLASFVIRLFNKRVCTTFSRRYFSQRMPVTVVATQRLLHFLGRPYGSTGGRRSYILLVCSSTDLIFCSGKSSPAVLPKQHIPPNSDLHYTGNFGFQDTVYFATWIPSSADLQSTLWFIDDTALIVLYSKYHALELHTAAVLLVQLYQLSGTIFQPQLLKQTVCLFSVVDSRVKTHLFTVAFENRLWLAVT